MMAEKALEVGDEVWYTGEHCLDRDQTYIVAEVRWERGEPYVSVKTETGTSMWISMHMFVRAARVVKDANGWIIKVGDVMRSKRDGAVIGTVRRFGNAYNRSPDTITYETGGWDYASSVVVSKPDADPAPTPAPSRYETVAQEIAALVTLKQAAYGDAFGKSGAVLRILYPDGISLEQYDDVLTLTRILDKMFRIATDKDALGESPWKDILGYALLAVARERKDK